jgi:hypothetical protein
MAFTDIDQVASVVPVLDEHGGVVGQQVVVKDLGEVSAEARAAIAEISADGKGKINLSLSIAVRASWISRGSKVGSRTSRSTHTNSSPSRSSGEL